jgi:hypothetical protein
LYEPVFAEAEKRGITVPTTALEDFAKKEPRARGVLYRMLDYVAPGWREAGEETASAVPGSPTRAMVDAQFTPKSGVRDPKLEAAYQQALKQLGFADEVTGAVSLRGGHALRSELLRVGRALERKAEAPQGFTKKLIEVIDTDLHEAAGDLSPALRKADAFWKTEVAERYETAFLRQLARKQPSQVAKTLLAGETAPEFLRQARRAVDPSTWAKVEGATVEELFESARRPDGTLDGQQILTTLNQNTRRLSEIFGAGPAGTARLEQVARRPSRRAPMRSALPC